MEAVLYAGFDTGVVAGGGEEILSSDRLVYLNILLSICCCVCVLVFQNVFAFRIQIFLLTKADKEIVQ